jgi:hypothetical protein
MKALQLNLRHSKGLNSCVACRSLQISPRCAFHLPFLHTPWNHAFQKDGMEPITALGLAANVCQFVEFAAKIVSKGQKLRNAPEGLLIEHANIYSATRRVIELNNRLVASAKEHSEHTGVLGNPADDQIQRACKEINQVAADLIEALEKLRLPKNAGRWKSMRQAVKTVVGKNGVEKMKNDLMVHRQRLDTALLTSLWQVYRS